MHSDGRHQEQLPDGDELGRPEGIIAIVNVIPDMGALSALSLKDNRLLTAEAGKILSDMLAANTVLKELDLSSNRWYDDGWKGDGPGFSQQLAVGIKDNGALSKLDLSVNRISATEAGMLDATCKAKGVDLAL
jgi:hypothetical protein